MPTEPPPDPPDQALPSAVAAAIAAVAGLLAFCASDLGVAASSLAPAPPGAGAGALPLPGEVTPGAGDVGRRVAVSRRGSAPARSRIMLRINRDGRSVASCTGEDVVVCDHTLRAGDAGRRFTGAVGTEGERGWTFRPAPLTLEPAT